MSVTRGQGMVGLYTDSVFTPLGASSDLSALDRALNHWQGVIGDDDRREEIRAGSQAYI